MVFKDDAEKNSWKQQREIRRIITFQFDTAITRGIRCSNSYFARQLDYCARTFGPVSFRYDTSHRMTQGSIKFCLRQLVETFKPNALLYKGGECERALFEKVAPHIQAEDIGELCSKTKRAFNEFPTCVYHKNVGPNFDGYVDCALQNVVQFAKEAFDVQNLMDNDGVTYEHVVERKNHDILHSIVTNVKLNIASSFAC